MVAHVWEAGTKMGQSWYLEAIPSLQVLNFVSVGK